MAARRGTRRRYLIYPRFRYQSPTKGDATTRRASATRSHEPSRGTKLLFSVSLLSTSTGARSRSSLSLSLLSAVASPSLSLSSIRSRECHVSPLPLPTSLQPTRSCPTALHAPSTSAHAPTGTHTHTHTHVVARNITYTQGTCRRARPRVRTRYRRAARSRASTNDRCIYLFSRFQSRIAKSSGERFKTNLRGVWARVPRCLPREENIINQVLESWVSMGKWFQVPWKW